MLRVLCAICLTLSLTLLPNNAKSDPMSDMFQRWGVQGTSTSPGVYESQERGFAIGGKLNARVRTETIPPALTLKLPSIKAGCGGLDIFAGSFSWISSENFTKTMKAIGQNAIGYAFSLGLEVVCSNCAAQLNKLQHFMNQITKMSGDTCAATKALVGTAFDALGDQSIGSCISKAASSEKGDYANAWLTCAGKEEAEMKENLKAKFPWNPEAGQKRDPMVAGNSTTVSAAKEAQLDTYEIQWMISLLGTYHVETPDPTDEATTRCTYKKPTVTMRELIDGGTLKLITCESGSLDDRCLKYGTETVTGVAGYKTMVFNNIKAIYDKNKTKPSLDLDGAEKIFIERTTMPIQKYTRQLASLRDDTVALTMIDQISDFTAAEYAWETLERYIYILEHGSSNANSACLKDDPSLQKQIMNARQSRQMAMEKIVADLNAKTQTMAFMDRIFKVPNLQTAKALTGSFSIQTQK